MSVESANRIEVNFLKIPKKPNYSKKPFPTDKERRDWDDFVNMTIAVGALIIALLNLFFQLLK